MVSRPYCDGESRSGCATPKEPFPRPKSSCRAPARIERSAHRSGIVSGVSSEGVHSTQPMGDMVPTGAGQVHHLLTPRSSRSSSLTAQSKCTTDMRSHARPMCILVHSPAACRFYGHSHLETDRRGYRMGHERRPRAVSPPSRRAAGRVNPVAAPGDRVLRANSGLRVTTSPVWIRHDVSLLASFGGDLPYRDVALVAAYP